MEPSTWQSSIEQDQSGVTSIKGGDTGAELQVDPPNIPGFKFDGNGLVTRFAGYNPTVTLRIRTRYQQGISPADTSNYGRGTTPEDVTNKATSLRFHEGSHGEDYLNFVRTHPFPVFTGKVGMKVADFKKALKDYKEANAAWSEALTKVRLQTDCVGKSIDEIHQGEKGYKKICL